MFKAGWCKTKSGHTARFDRAGSLAVVVGIGYVSYDADGICVSEDARALGLDLELSTWTPRDEPITQQEGTDKA